MHQQPKLSCILFGIALMIGSLSYQASPIRAQVQSTINNNNNSNNGNSNSRLKRLSCAAELNVANKTFSDWALKARQMISDSDLKANIRDHISKEENKLYIMIADFGARLNRRPIEKLVNDLVAIRRQSNKVALDVYLKTYDARWPQSSVHLGVAVERVQHACLSSLDRAAMMVLNSPKELNSLIQARGRAKGYNYSISY